MRCKGGRKSGGGVVVDVLREMEPDGIFVSHGTALAGLLRRCKQELMETMLGAGLVAMVARVRMEN